MAVGAAQWLRRWTRVIRLTVHFGRGVVTAALLFPFQSAERRRREIEVWSRRLLDILRVRLSIHGKPPPPRLRPLMLVSNHVSWLDIFVVDAVVAARFVA